mgnify:CR=1 FL=1
MFSINQPLLLLKTKPLNLNSKLFISDWDLNLGLKEFRISYRMSISPWLDRHRDEKIMSDFDKPNPHYVGTGKKFWKSL